jgi:outer membrane protein
MILKYRCLCALWIGFFTLFASFASYSQTQIALKDIPALVKDNLPHLNAKKSEIDAIKNLISYEKRSLMPELTVAYQANVATFNNITGMSYPGLIMPISGPPSLNNDINFVPGSAATAFLSWRPITFGQRLASVDRAAAQYKLASADYNEQTFKYQYLAINSYLDAVYFKQVMLANQANIKRYQSSLDQSLELAKNGLRPGIDTLQLQSSIAQAEIDLLQTQNNYKQKLIELSHLIGNTERGADLVLTDTSFNGQNITIDPAINITNHPYHLAASAQMGVTSAMLDEVKKTWRPKLDFWGNVYGRGSGIDVNNNINKSEGFSLTRNNIGFGIQLSFPILQFHQLNSKKQQYGELLKSAAFRIEQVKLDINKQADMAMQQYRSNVAISRNTAIRLKSAIEVYNSLKVSYDSGLVDFTRLTQAQFELQQAEINDTSAKLIIQRSLLEMSVAKGDLNLFYNR